MRFAYIDSQGNEVAIPSVDALALRIELGAIGPDTELYDAQADRWGPARSHEIFHTLSRESEDEGFVAPPPPVAPPPGDGSAPDDEAPVAGEGPGGEETAAPEPADDAVELGELAPDEDQAGSPAVFDVSGEFADGGEDEEDQGDEEPAAPAPSIGGDDLGFDLTLADEEEPSPGAEEDVEAATGEGVMDFGTDAGMGEAMSFDLADDGPAAEAGEGSAGGGQEEAGAFDFGGMDALEVEEPEVGEEAEAAAGAMDFGGGLQMEESLADQDDFEEMPDASGGLDLEQPMSEFSSDAPPAWMEQDGPEAEDDGAMDFSSAGETEEADEEEAAPVRARSGGKEERGEEKAAPRSRPSPPRRKPRRSFAGPMMGIVVVAALGAGGWFGWQAFQNRPVEPETPALPPVTIPDIPAELLPTMRDLGEVALAATVDELERRADEAGLPAEPSQDWLSGVYLANASQFADVEEYWLAVRSFVEEMREVDTRIFHQEYQEALAAEGIAGDTAAVLAERADSGFLATREDRFEAYAEMGDLVSAALGLHDFLLENEDAIEYDPAAGGMSADPVLEAIPASRELGDEMWEGVDRITGALDQLGTLDRVTTQRLLAVLFDRIRRAGFQ